MSKPTQKKDMCLRVLMDLQAAGKQHGLFSAERQTRLFGRVDNNNVAYVRCCWGLTAVSLTAHRNATLAGHDLRADRAAVGDKDGL